MTNEYESLCIAKEKELAELMGWKYIEGDLLLLIATPPHLDDARIYEHLPKWTRSWSVCGPLMVEYDVDVEIMKKRAIASIGPHLNRAYFSDHPSKDRAVMFAIVCSVIEFLKARKV